MRAIPNIIWLLLGGLWLALAYLVAALIRGIPLAPANLKLIPVSLVPPGKDIVPVDHAQDWARNPAALRW